MRYRTDSCAHAHRATFVLALALAACSDPSSPPLDAGTPDAGAIDGGVCTTCPPPDPCDGFECPDPRHTCRNESGSAECRCPSGTHAEGDRCVDDTACTPTSCGPGGTCAVEGGELRCECADGYAGDRCESCASGYFPDGEGRCDGDPCDPSPCESADRQRCVVDPALGAQCLCKGGAHEEVGACVPDVTCGPETCAMRGTCTDGADGPSCACDAGYAGPFCGECAEGYHPDGAGGCTADPCLPDPCTAAPFTRCIASPEGATCGCELDFHEASGDCVPDETCEPDTCSGRGVCAVRGGRASCGCEPGYAGDRCERCDPGYHDDGAGGCTTDRCLPDPCTEPNRGVCRETASSYACDCDPGHHEDGVGGCTTDPCLPHPCGDQACRVDAGGAVECYTPVCDDGNPCTDTRSRAALASTRRGPTARLAPPPRASPDRPARPARAAEAAR